MGINVVQKSFRICLCTRISFWVGWVNVTRTPSNRISLFLQINRNKKVYKQMTNDHLKRIFLFRCLGQCDPATIN